MVDGGRVVEALCKRTVENESYSSFLSLSLLKVGDLNHYYAIISGISHWQWENRVDRVRRQ